MNDFVSQFAEQFEITDPKEITATTHFKDLADWDSLASLSIISMVKETYNVELLGGDIRRATTVEEVYNLVVSK